MGFRSNELVGISKRFPITFVPCFHDVVPTIHEYYPNSVLPRYFTRCDKQSLSVYVHVRFSTVFAVSSSFVVQLLLTLRDCVNARAARFMVNQARIVGRIKSLCGKPSQKASIEIYIHSYRDTYILARVHIKRNRRLSRLHAIRLTQKIHKHSRLRR